MADRQKSNDTIDNILKITNIQYNKYAGAQKLLGPILGRLNPLGSVGVQKNVSPGKLIAFFNSDALVHYVKIGKGSLTAPTDASDGIALKPLDYTIIALFDDTDFIADSALVYAYEILDDTFVL